MYTIHWDTTLTKEEKLKNEMHTSIYTMYIYFRRNFHDIKVLGNS